MNKQTRFELALIFAAISAAPSLFTHETESANPSSGFESQRLCLDALIKDRAPQENGGQVASAEPEKPVERELRGGEKQINLCLAANGAALSGHRCWQEVHRHHPL